jgi:hypothetical protein
MLDQKQVGNLTELQCITAFYELGYKVSLPYGENSRYDFIADIDGILIRVQVKSCKEKEDGSTISFPCRSTRVNSTQCIHRRYTKDEIDYFCTYYNGQCYLVPVEECSDEKKLRFSAPKNNQGKGINYAKDYELLSQVHKLKSK